MQKFYVYRFKNEENEIIYVGKTKNFKQRMITHFSGYGHLPKECYEEVRKIEFLVFEKESLMGIKELYYIAKYQPKYNVKDKSDYLVFSALEEGDKWEDCLYAKQFVNKEPTKKELELMEEIAVLKQQMINLRNNLQNKHFKEMERLRKKYEEINEVKNLFAKWNEESHRIISAYERKTNLIWCKNRKKLVRNYNK